MAFDSTPDAEVTARDRVMRLRDFLAELPAKKFDMRLWPVAMTPGDAHDCGTTACIGGWANALFGKAGHTKLGLDSEQECALFMPRGVNWRKVTTADAVAVLDRYLANGKIDWSVAQ